MFSSAILCFGMSYHSSLYSSDRQNKKTYWDWFLFGNCLVNYCLGMLIDVATGAHRGLAQKHYIVTPKCGLL